MSKTSQDSKGRKNAILIMAHHRPDLLQMILDALDHPNISFIIHMDKKFSGDLSFSTKYSKIYYTKQTNIMWGGYSQIRGTLLLIETALKTGENYSYLHFITGAMYPIKPVNELLNYFNQNKNVEYIGFDNERNFDFRIKYYYPFSELGKPHSKMDYKKVAFRNKIVALQKKIHLNRLKKRKIEVKKGSAYFTITPSFAKYLVSQKKVIKKMFRKTICGDEVFIQTIAWNSPFKEKIYDYTDEYNGNKVISCWPKAVGEYRESLSFIEKDYDILKQSNAFFGCKFESKNSLKLIKRINKEILKLS